MSLYVLSCPLCSVCPPAGTHEGPGFTRTPRIHQGRRCGKFWFSRTTGCNHCPQVGNESHATAQAISEPWNTWALAEATAKADRLALPPDRRADWLRQVGADTFSKPSNP